MYNQGYPPSGGYPPAQPSGYPPQQPGGYPSQGGYPAQGGSYPPQQTEYPPQQPAAYPPQPAGYPPQQPPAQPGGIGFESLSISGGQHQPPSFGGMAYAASAAMSFRQPTYPAAQPPYGGAPQPPYGGAQLPYGGAPSSQTPYGGAPAQPPYGGGPAQTPYGGSTAPQQPYGGATQPPYSGGPARPSQPTYHGGPSQTSTPPRRPPPPSATPHPQYSSPRHQPSIPTEPVTQGTVREATNFDAQRDAEIIRKAMKGIGTDEKAITSVLGCRSNQQRQRIKIEFSTMFGKDIVKELKSELSGNYESTVLALLMTPADYDAYECFHAISGVGTDEKCLIEILCSRSNAEIRALRDSYSKMYNRNLEKDLIDDSSGNFKRLLVSLVQGGRDENTPLDQNKAAQDARALYDAGEARWGTDESRFNVILGSRSFSQIRLILREYEKISKRTLVQAIKSEMSGDLKDGMVAVVRCADNRPLFFAGRLYWSMKGLGTDDKTLIRIMVSRCEVDMVQIKQAFQHEYGKTLESFIKDDCSGDYKKLLIQLCG